MTRPEAIMRGCGRHRLIFAIIDRRLMGFKGFLPLQCRLSSTICGECGILHAFSQHLLRQTWGRKGIKPLDNH